jgi:formylglycine-generating enzyme required for sulfatase activity
MNFANKNWINWIQMNKKLLRGGSLGSIPRLCRSACRGCNHPDNRNGNVGFRVCCLPQD